MNRVLVTGATGFVGRHLCRLLVARGYDVIGACRVVPAVQRDSGVKLQSIGDVGTEVDWAPLLGSVDCVVHLAARVHVMKESHHDPLAEFRRVNVEGTRRLLDGIRACNRPEQRS